MELDIKEQEAIRQYLLGQVPPEDLPQLEERLLIDKAFFEELLIIEDELVDQYLSGELSESERKSFETHFLLAPDRRQKVRFAQALNKYVGAVDPLPDEDPAAAGASGVARDVPKPPPKKPWYSIFLPSQNPILSYSLAAALVLIVGTVSWLAVKNWRTTGSPDPGKVLAVTLTPGLTRSDGGGKKITIDSDTGTVQLRLQLTRDDNKTYRVIVIGDDRSPVWTGNNLQATNEAGTKFVAADLPARSLAPGVYRATISGTLADGTFEDLDSYSFQITKP